MFARRDLLKTVLLGSAWISASACAHRPALRVVAASLEAQLTRFPQGVASADPAPDAIMLWTRVEPREAGRDETLYLQVSERPDFAHLIVEEQVIAPALGDHCVHATIDRLTPDKRYYYRFVDLDGLSSPHGRTATAPAPDARRPFRFASASCQNFQTGRYHAYRSLIERDQSGEQPIDFVLFLGDFIYELIFRNGVRPLTLPGRDWEGGDGISGMHLEYQYAESLEDYRYLYRAYLSDPYLRQARALWPFLCIWDDHEFTNDCWQSMSTYTSEGTPSQRRRVAASQAWFEYVPARLIGPLAKDFRTVAVADAPFGPHAGIDPAREPNNVAAINAIGLPRALRWGRSGEIILTDARSYRSAPAISPEDALGVSLHPRALLPRDMIEEADNTDRSMLGAAQFDWAAQRLVESDADWKLLASSVPMMPIGFDFRYDPASGRTIKGETVFTIDSWEGYPKERQALLDVLADNAIKNTIILSGDHHMHMAGSLETGPADARKKVASEFCVGGVSSTSLGDVLKSFTAGAMANSDAAPLISGPDAAPGPRWANLSLLYTKEESERCLAAHQAGQAFTPNADARRLPHLNYIDVQSYGILVVTVTADAAHACFDSYSQAQIAQDYDNPQAPMTRIAFSVAHGQPMSAPRFEGPAPFPYAIG